MKIYRNTAYLSGRVMGCIVNTKIRGPVKVMDRGEGDSFFCYVLKNSDRVYIDKTEMDLTPVPLGFVNGSTLTCLVRMPMREDWKQGLRGRNCVSLMGLCFDDILYKDLYKTIMGIYPSFDEAFKEENTAFNRDWAVGTTDQILYKGRVVGTTTKFKDKYSYLYKKFLEVVDESNS